ncbi:MAG: hypothetical protein KAT68_04150 [Bacteroidales bacterium]|nr:hypothetical protein [Bacteroidales bacterium]
MQNTHFILILFFLLQLSNTKLLAQNDSLNDISYYLDDDRGISDGRNLVKINFLSIINGDIPVYYERILSKSIGIEVGVGLLLPYYCFEISNLFSEDTKIENPDYGYSLWIQPKYYFQQKAPELNYFGIQLRQRNYNQDNQTIVFTDLTINLGLQFIIRKRIIFDYNVGVGCRFINEKSADINKSFGGLAIPTAFKLGYIL